ncbi:unnamed protein product [marine sediment metagenome]|uniref:proline--tRNA ligase n=1 Tax=marine sediment metagenome TaxID=412755 RepID=X1JGR4_9ZZZZ
MRVHIDERDLRPGNKFYYWERRGVPLRLEIGPEDVKKKQVTAVRRDTGEKQAIGREVLKTKVKQLLGEITSDMCKRAWKLFHESVKSASDMGTVKRMMEKRGGIARVPWCGGEACGKAFEEQTGGNLLGEEFDGKAPTGVCPICSKRAKANVLIARTY